MCLGVPGQVIKMQGDDPLTRMGTVKFGGITKEVNLAYVPEVKEGDYVIVHVGFAISVLDESAANRIFDTLKEIDSLEVL